MLDKLNEIPMLKSIGITGIITVLGGLIPLLGKMGIITSVTSSKVEKLLFSKEKRAYVSFIQFILLYLFSIIFTSCVTIVSSEFKLTMTWVYVVSGIAGASFLIIVAIVLMPERYFKDKAYLFISFLIYVIHIISLFLITPFLITTTINETNLSQTQIHSIFNDPIKYHEITSVLLLIICVTNLLFLTLSVVTTIQFLKKFDRERYFLIENDLKWFVFYPIDREHILLGNEAIINNATEFKIEETKKILTKRIFRYVIPKSSNEKSKKEKREKNIKTKYQKKNNRRKIKNNGITFSKSSRKYRK